MELTHSKKLYSYQPIYAKVINPMTFLKSLIFFFMLAIFISEAQAVSVYDGIYNTSPNIGYVIFREQNGSMVGVLNQTVQGDLQWNASQGTLIGNTVRMTSIIGYNTTVIDVTFTSTATFIARLISCVAVQRSCLFPNGTTFTGLKIW